MPVTWSCFVVLASSNSGPWLAEKRKGGTPWHAHHIAERYGLLAIIALGEGVVGTVASLSAVVSAQGWTFDAVLVAVAGIGLTFGMWWVVFRGPGRELLHAHRDRSFWFGYLQIVMFGAIVATGAGLHVAAYYIEHHSEARLGGNRAGRRHAGRDVHRLGLRAVHAMVRKWTRSTSCWWC